MSKLLKRLLASIFVFAVFCLAGYLASSMESFHNSIVASTAVFGVSFVSILGGAVKVWYDIFG